MAGNNWVYLPDLGEYINLSYVKRVLNSTKLVMVDFPDEESFRSYDGRDADALKAALRKLVADDK